MGKISEEARKRYHERVQEYLQQTEFVRKREQSVVAAIQHEPNGAAYKRVALAGEQLDLAALYLILNRVSVSMLDVKNEEFLNGARKACLRSIIYLEQVVSDLIDAPFSDYSERLETIENLPDEQRYELIRKLGFTIRSVEEDLGEKSRWKWSFVDLEGRFATVAKNIVNLKTFIAGLDPRVPGYEARIDHLQLIKEHLQRAAEGFRERFEVRTARIDDFKQAIAYLLALKRMHVLLGESDQAEGIKRRAEVWKTRMDDEEKRLEAQRG